MLLTNKLKQTLIGLSYYIVQGLGMQRKDGSCNVLMVDVTTKGALKKIFVKGFQPLNYKGKVTVI